MQMVDVDFNSYKLYIDGVQVNKTPVIVKPPETNKKSKHPIIVKIIIDKNTTKEDIDQLLYKLDDLVITDKLHEVQFWGDEPLLYFEYIKRICENRFFGKSFISIITNGYLLDEEKIENINKNSINVCIKHNGPAQKHSIFNRLGALISKLNKVTFSCCLTKDNFDVCEINDWFYSKFKKIGLDYTKTTLNYNEVEVLDEDSKKYAITDLAKYQLCLRMFFERCKAKDPTIILNNLYHHVTEGSLVKFCQDIVKSEPIFDCTKCCIEFADVLIIDTKGYVRECESLDDTHKIGRFEDLPNKTYKLDKRCCDCKYRNLCKGICPLIPLEYFNINCSMNMARYEVVADFGLKIISEEIANIAKKS